jgi:hypothetical protein
MKSNINRYRVISQSEIKSVESNKESVGILTAAPLTEDSYIEKVKKYIPVEIVGGYFFLYKFIEDNGENEKQTALFGTILFVCLILTPLYKYFQLSEDNLPPPIRQIIISTLSFIAWSYYLGGLSKALSIVAYDSTLATVIMVLLTLTTPLLEKIINQILSQKK